MEPEQRVKAFIASYFKAHRQLHSEKFRDRTSDRFDRWNVLVTEIDAEHGINRGCMALSGVIHGSSPHIPEFEPVVAIRHVEDRTFVETCTQENGLPHYYEYELHASDADWRIARIREFLRAADAPFMDDRNRPRFTNPPTLPLRELPEDDAGVDGDALFTAGRNVRVGDRAGSIEVHPVGRLKVSTGQLVVGDLGYDAGVLGMIGQRVPPGEYTADVAVAADRVAGLRVRFSDQPIASWHPADHNRYRSVSNVVGVDAGDVAIMDLAAVMTVKSRDKERAFDAHAENARQRYTMLSLAASNDTVICDSGFGDGAYPVYWGVDHDRQPVVLVVDFMLFPRTDSAATDGETETPRPTNGEDAKTTKGGTSLLQRLLDLGRR